MLIVDDNRGYREAFARNLTLRGYVVSQAEDGMDALRALQDGEPDVIVTDLAMGHATEGLELIRQVKAVRPYLPVIMISAVGTMDEGAEAMRWGACQVISKSRIDEEIDSLYSAIDAASQDSARARAGLEELRTILQSADSDPQAAVRSLGALLSREDTPAPIKREAYERWAELGAVGPAESGAPTDGAAEDRRKRAEKATKETLSEVVGVLRKEIPNFDGFEKDTRESLTTAEYLFQQSQGSNPGVDFSRSMGFSYCFAVENQVKASLRKKLQRFFADPETPPSIEGLLEKNRRSISIFFQQSLLRAQHGAENEATIDNFHHTFLRILEHRGKYRPDGLKALGIILICFGRSHRFKRFNEEVEIDNPLGIKGFKDSREVMRFAGLLINLQHYRNPYIHPELSEMIKLSKIRATAFECLTTLDRLH